MNKKNKKIEEINDVDILDAEIEEIATVYITKKTRKRNKKNINNQTDSSIKLNEKLYFTKETQEAINFYLQLEDSNKIEKEELYLQYILPSFEKLVENLVNIHKFSGFDESYKELKNDCITFLFESLKKFDSSRGTNAFSYFNVIAKNWLIIKSKQKQNRIKKIINIENFTQNNNQQHNQDNQLNSNDKKIFESNMLVFQEPIEKEKDETKQFISNVLIDVKKMARSKNEINCINSIISIFNNIDNIDLLNKNALFLYLRELSGLTPKQLTVTIQNLRKYYSKSKKDRIKNENI